MRTVELDVRHLACAHELRPSRACVSAGRRISSSSWRDIRNKQCRTGGHLLRDLCQFSFAFPGRSAGYRSFHWPRVGTIFTGTDDQAFCFADIRVIHTSTAVLLLPLAKLVKLSVLASSAGPLHRNSR